MRGMKDLVQANWVTAASTPFPLSYPVPVLTPPPQKKKAEPKQKLFKILFIISQVNLWILFLVTN